MGRTDEPGAILKQVRGRCEFLTFCVTDGRLPPLSTLDGDQRCSRNRLHNRPPHRPRKSDPALPRKPPMRRVCVFAFGVTSYVLFLVTFLYAVGWVGNFIVPRSIDSPATGRLWPALLINGGLLLVFAMQ